MQFPIRGEISQCPVQQIPILRPQKIAHKTIRRQANYKEITERSFYIECTAGRISSPPAL